MKIIYLVFTILITLSASPVKLNYIGELSFFGKVGVASMYYSNDGKQYHIKISGNGTGIVGKLTKNTKYIYESIGSVVDDKLIPNEYISREISKDKNKTKIYKFDYDNNKTIVKENKIENVTESQYNILSFEYDISNKIVKKNDVEELDEVYKDDMVSVFFNKRNKLLQMKKGETKLIKAVGSEDTQNGVVIKLIDKKEDKYTYSITLEKDYLEGGSEDVTFVLDSNNILYETRVDGILFFGNATVKRY